MNRTAWFGVSLLISAGLCGTVGVMRDPILEAAFYPSNDAFGSAVAGAGDVNRDGRSDVVVGAYRANVDGMAGAGTVRVFSGKDGSLLRTLNGVAEGEGFGWSVAGGIDVDRDGWSDVIVGAQFASCGKLREAGEVRIFSGKDGKRLLAFSGREEGGRIGYSVASCGDVNRDGWPDVITGARFASPRGVHRAGAAFVFSGKDGALILTLAGAVEDEGLGCCVAGARDVNHDGFPDVIVGAPWASRGATTNCGFAKVFSGKDGALLMSLHGTTDNANLGNAVLGVGDLNGDGFADIAVGAPGASLGPGSEDSGEVRIVSGRDGSMLRTLRGEAYSFFGSSIALMGDVNGDGKIDIAVAAAGANPGNREWAGQVRLISGKDGVTLVTANGTRESEGFGYPVANAGDTDGDGTPDFIVGRVECVTGGAKVFSGRTGKLLLDLGLTKRK